MSQPERSCDARLSRVVHRASRRDPRRDDGFSLVELLVTLLIIAVVIPLAFGLIKNLVQQSQNVHDTVTGIQQDQTAGEALLQYLHGASVILPGSGPTTLNANILAGVNSSATPYTSTLQATLTNSASPNDDATFTTTLTPSGGTATNVGTYDAVNSSAVFTYYYNTSTSTSTSTTTSSTSTTTSVSGLSSTSTPTTAELSEIVAVGVSVTFLAGPHVPTEGFQAVHPTTFQTTVYLQNAAGAPAPASSTVVTFSGGTQAGTSVTVTATVAPVPDGGTATFTVDLGGSPAGYCTSVFAVSTTTGTATCTFIPTSAGTYEVTAAFSGTGHFQPSTSAATPLDILPPAASTTTTVNTPSATVNYFGGGDTMTVSATVSPTPDAGTVAFTINQQGNCSSSCTKTGSAPVVTSGAGAGTATWSGINVLSGTTYSVSATYAGDSNYLASSGTLSPNYTTP